MKNVWVSGGAAPYGAETAAQYRHRLDADDRRLLVLLHGYGGTSVIFFPVESSFSSSIVYWHLLEMGRCAGYGIDAAGNGWGNDAAIDMIDDAVEWARGASGFATDEPAILFGHSMGGCNAVNYAAAHPSKVAGVILGAPAVDLDAFHLMGAYSASINTAYGGNYAVNAAGHKPLELAAGIDVPFRICSAVDDPVVSISSVRAFHASLGSDDKELIEAPDGGHNAFWPHMDGVELADFVAGLP